LKYQRKSDAPKFGEGDAHSRGKHRVAQVIEDYVKQTKKSIFKDVMVDLEFPSFTKIVFGLNNEYPWPHNYDIMLRINYINGIHKIIAIEIDGSTHEKPRQKYKDLIARDIFDLVYDLDQQRRIPEFDEHELVRIDLGKALYAEPEEIIQFIFK
jgi:hypothetical protein